MKITKFERAPEGHLTARVTLDTGEATFCVHRKFGSWMRDFPGRPGWLKELPREVVQALASKALTFEKREARETEKVAA